MAIKLKNNIYYNRSPKIREELLLLNKKNNMFITNCIQKWKEHIQNCYNALSIYALGQSRFFLQICVIMLFNKTFHIVDLL